MSPSRLLFALLAIVVLLLPALGAALRPSGARADTVPERAPNSLLTQTAAEEHAQSEGCLSCHGGIEPMHASGAIKLGCVDCHGGDPDARLPESATTDSPQESPAYQDAKTRAHVAPRFPERWQRAASEEGTTRYSSANPERAYTLTLDESAEFIRFVNPGDLRVAAETCGPCHAEQVDAVRKSPMTTSSVFWAAAGYANGILGTKWAILGESHGRDGQPQRVEPVTPPTEAERARGALPFLLPLPRWETTQPGEYFRVFEDGGLLQPSFFPEIGNPNPFDEAGRPDVRVSNRGRGTGLRVSPGVLNLHKTRLNDPHLSMLGTNDHPGDYRSGGCTACHVVYANDRDPVHSAGYAAYGHRGTSFSADPTLPRDESGHPIRHQFTRAVPTSQCMVCHMHQPNSFLNTYLGYTMWDYETDGEHLWPEQQRYPTAEERRTALDHNPEGAAPRGLWSDRDFLAGVSELNPELEHTQFADYHGHGWVFRAVYKRDRQGRLLDADGAIVDFSDPERFDKAVHLRDIHLERGMHCVDCHFSQDAHGDGLIHGEYGNAIEIECQDCHGDVRATTDLRTSGPAAPPATADLPGGTDLSVGTTPFGRKRFAWRGGSLYQRSMLDPDLEWTVTQVRDTVTEGHEDYNELSALAKTLRRDGQTWGVGGWNGWLADPHTVAGAETIGSPEQQLAHDDSSMTCYSCHSSWITSCFGCHLPQQANEKSAVHHFEGGEARNYATYNPQVIRTDVYMLGRNSPIKGGKVAPVRSSSALVLSSINLNRKRIYIQQPPISAPGYSSQAFNPHVPHTVRATETKGCSDCHLSEAGDNNAWMAQLLTQGTGFVNFIGRYAWVGEEHGFEGVAVTEWEEPQAVLGSSLQRLAYPDFHAEHEARGGELEEAHHHHAEGAVRSLQLRGEYLFTAEGAGGFRVYDVANIDNADFSERIVTAPVSPLGQKTWVETRFATAIALPTNMPIAPGRQVDPANQEQSWHPLYHYAYVSDRHEGLILVNVDTLTDGDPRNNFFHGPFDGRALTFNPGGALDGAETLTVAGEHVYLGTAAGFTVVDIDQPLEPRVVANLPEIRGATDIDVQFRYAFVTDAQGLAVVDITFPEHPRLAARVPITDARAVYVARTYAYVAAGGQGLVIVDVERPEAPRIDQVFDADGRLGDTHDVQVGSTNASLFAYVADGHNGLAVLQLTSPSTVPGYLGFSPRPAPRLIATRHTEEPALALSRGLDRDRAVDESGNQVSIFNRIGARPFTEDEMQRLYLRDGEVYRVRDAPPEASLPSPSAGERHEP